jgi:hypothetical protein
MVYIAAIERIAGGGTEREAVTPPDDMASPNRT